MVAESIRSGASGAGGRALSRSPRGPGPWRGGAPGPGLGDIPEFLTPSPVRRGPRSQEAAPPPAGPPLPSPSPKPEAPARGYGPLRSSEKQRDAAAAAAGPRGLRARPLLSPPRLPQGRQARGQDARLPGRGQGPGRAIRRYRLSRGSRGRLAAFSWPSTSDWGPVFGWAACGVRAWMEKASSAAAAPPPSGLLEGGNPAPRAP